MKKLILLFFIGIISSCQRDTDRAYVEVEYEVIESSDSTYSVNLKQMAEYGPMNEQTLTDSTQSYTKFWVFPVRQILVTNNGDSDVVLQIRYNGRSQDYELPKNFEGYLP